MILLTPAVAPAGLLDALSTAPRLDREVETDYRIRYPTVDDLERGAPPPDRFGRERLGDANARVVRAYARTLSDLVVREVLDELPLLAELGRRYDELTTFRVLGGEAGSRSSSAAGKGCAAPHGVAGAAPARALGDRRRPPPDEGASRAARPCDGASGRRAAAPSDGQLGDTARGPRVVMRTALRPVQPAPDPLTVRLRLHAAFDRLSPGVEVTRGAFRGRLGLDTVGNRLEVTVTHRLSASLEVRLTHVEPLDGDVGRLQLTVSLPF